MVNALYIASGKPLYPTQASSAPAYPVQPAQLPPYGYGSFAALNVWSILTILIVRVASVAHFKSCIYVVQLLLIISL